MDTLEAYWDNYSFISVQIGFLWLIVFFSFLGKRIKAKKTSKISFGIVVLIPILILCHILYFKFQHYTPHYLEFSYGSEYGVVKIEDIVSVEQKYYGGRVSLLLKLSNGSELDWNYPRVEVLSASKKRIKRADPLDALDYK